MYIENIEREKEIYNQYQTTISYFIAELEVRDAEYPIEVFNEIRATFTHLSRYKLQDNENDLISAERHIKRAILDCFKYMCISIKEEIKEFRTEYRNVDLSIANNGEFLLQLNHLEQEADSYYIDAKRAEVKGEVPDDILYRMFEDAYNKYHELLCYLRSSHEAILFASNHTKKHNLVNKISIGVTTISIIVAIVCALF